MSITKYFIRPIFDAFQLRMLWLHPTGGWRNDLHSTFAFKAYEDAATLCAKRNKMPKPKALVARSEYQIAVNELTNHQRNRWARAGYPGMKKKDAGPVRAYREAVT